MPEAEATPPAVRPLGRRRRRAVAFARRHPSTAAVLLILAAALGVRLGWGWHIGRQLAVQREEIRARGEPVDASDRVVGPLPDAENAWTLLDQAAKLDARLAPGNQSVEAPAYPPFGAEWDRAAAASEQANVQTFRLARQARGRPRVRFANKVLTPLAALVASHPADAHAVASTLAAGALHRHLAGDDAEAVERLLDALHLADLLYQDELGVSRPTADRLSQVIADGAKVVGSGLMLDAPAERRRAAALIAALLDERHARGAVRRWFTFHRLAVADEVGKHSAPVWFLRPLADHGVVRANRVATAAAKAAEAGNLFDALRLLHGGVTPPAENDHFDRWSPDEAPLPLPRFSRWFPAQQFGVTDLSERDADLEFRQHYLSVAERRAAAVILALRLYRAEHGRWPERLGQLVPAQLPAVPADPYRADGRPIGYVVLARGRPDGQDRPLVYFEAAGATDDPIPYVNPEPMFGWQYDPREGRLTADGRQYRDVTRWVPERRPDPPPVQE